MSWIKEAQEKAQREAKAREDQTRRLKEEYEAATKAAKINRSHDYFYDRPEGRIAYERINNYAEVMLHPLLGELQQFNYEIYDHFRHFDVPTEKTKSYLDHIYDPAIGWGDGQGCKAYGREIIVKSPHAERFYVFSITLFAINDGATIEANFYDYYHRGGAQKRSKKGDSTLIQVHSPQDAESKRGYFKSLMSKSINSVLLAHPLPEVTQKDDSTLATLIQAFFDLF